MECGKLVDWAACVCATIANPGPTATWSAMFAHFECSVTWATTAAVCTKQVFVSVTFL